MGLLIQKIAFKNLLCLIWLVEGKAYFFVGMFYIT